MKTGRITFCSVFIRQDIIRQKVTGESSMTDFYIRTKEDLMAAVDSLGFLPFFAHEIEGFSIEEHVDPRAYFSDEEGVWEWKGPVIQELRCAYGKFFNKKAGFISKKWFPDFANYRRDGYDFDARMDEGIGNYNDQFLYNIIASKRSILSKDAKAIGGYVKPKTKGQDQWEPRKGFDTQITRLQMQCYVTTSGFDYEVDKNGNFYGWGVARYATPESFFGKSFENKVYRRTPEESYGRIVRHLKKIVPEASEEQIAYFLRG